MQLHEWKGVPPKRGLKASCSSRQIGLTCSTFHRHCWFWLAIWPNPAGQMQAVASTSTLSTCWQCRLLATAAFAKRWQSTEAVSSLAPEPNYVPPPILSNPEISTSTRDRPSLQDLLALKPKRLRPPKPELPTTSSEFAVYTRRFNKAINAVSKAFQKDQIVSISQNDLNLKYKASRTSKLQVVRKIFTDYWNYPDPIQMAKLAREGGKSASVSKEASERSETDYHFQDQYPIY